MTYTSKETPVAVWRWGYQFANGKLYRFEPRRIVVMKAWPDLRAWYKTPCRGWKHTRKFAEQALKNYRVAPQPAFPAIEGPPTWWDAQQARDEEQIEQFFAHIPPTHRQEAARYEERGWQMLCAFARCPGMLDLSRQNAAIAFMLANCWVFKPDGIRQPMRAMRSWISKKQRVILDWLGFPGTNAVVRILARIPASALTVQRLLNLRVALRDEAFVKQLSHMPVMNTEIISIFGYLSIRRLAAPSLLRELLAVTPISINGPGVTRLLFDLRRLTDTLRLVPESIFLQVLASGKTSRARVVAKAMRAGFLATGRAQLEHVVAELEATLQHVRKYLKALVDSAAPFSAPPPYAGDAHIQPITTPAALAEEGASMQHCIGTYFPEVYAGDVYVYRVLSPVRATLALVRTPEHEWRLLEARMAGNGVIAPTLAEALMERLTGHHDTAVTYQRNLNEHGVTK